MGFVHEARVLNKDLEPQRGLPVCVAKELVLAGRAKKHRDSPYTIILLDDDPSFSIPIKIVNDGGGALTLTSDGLSLDISKLQAAVGNPMIVSADHDNVISPGGDGGAFLRAFAGAEPGSGGLTQVAEDWHVVGEPGEPGYYSGWSSLTLGSTTGARFRKVGNIVEIQGTIQGGSIGDVFMLPAGHHPTVHLSRLCVAGSGIGRLDINIAGQVMLQGYIAGGDNGRVQLDCVFGVTNR